MAPRPDETDLIPDQEITSSELDAFQHGHFVDRLRATIKDTTTPSRIALFASWGSGKTSIARMLKPLVKKLGYEFARFDAFKYAREPLLREFIISLARETKGEPEAEKLRSELYEAQSNIRFRAALDRRLGDIARAFGRLSERLSSWLVVLLLIAAFIVAVLIDREIVEVAALASVGLAIVFAMLAIAQATGMLSIVGDSLRLTVSRERPDSPEQFELVARNFIQKTLKVTRDEKKLVVFVDELDRVDASEVIGTLETLKTFLDLPGCVFVVGADRRVIEKAIAHRARQETPVVVTDPYYSSASSYLDKIFQHQLELPDVMSDRLSRFARDLALKYGGVWRELREHGPGTLDDVVSVLVPIHVSNPRRVKILMNAYVHAYHLAQARHEIGYLGSPAIDRATEIAKLVVLRAEFPGFAEELLNDPDLTQDIPAWREQMAAEDEEEWSNGDDAADRGAVEN
ncbi:MAG: KAP family P-loop NTPase fold protein, partial [Solirubrobacterales bacterium]